MEKPDVRLIKSTFKLKISYAGCLGLSAASSAQFTVEMCVAARNCKKFTLTHYFGGPRSLMLTFLRSTSPVLIMISSMFKPICNHFHVRRSNSSRIMPFQGECPSFAPSFVGTPFTQ